MVAGISTVAAVIYSFKSFYKVKKASTTFKNKYLTEREYGFCTHHKSNIYLNIYLCSQDFFFFIPFFFFHLQQQWVKKRLMLTLSSLVTSILESLQQLDILSTSAGYEYQRLNFLLLLLKIFDQ